MRRSRDRDTRSVDDGVLLARYHRDRRPELRDALVERYLPLARSIARRYSRTPDGSEDVMQVACIALIKAIDRFDPSVGVAFSSYAVPCMEGEIKRHYRDCTWTVRVPRGVRALAVDAERTSDALRAELGRRPSASEVANRLGVSLDAVLEARTAMRAYRANTLDRGSSAGEDGHRPLAIGDTDPGYAMAEDREQLRTLLCHLSPRNS